MLAAAGWPLSEVFDKKIAAAMNMDPLLDGSDRVPSLLNGGLGKVSPAYWVACIGAGKSALVLFYNKNLCVRYHVSAIWLLYLAFICFHVIVFTNHVH